jgi:hypothetical protein
MGNSVSTPLALDERNSPYVRKPDLTHRLYTEHVEGNITCPDMLFQVFTFNFQQRVKYFCHERYRMS